jgi:Cof subfamily protein (haloacid dehalogenase superfamily)
MIKLIVCDMDGTLVCKDGQLPSNFASTLYAMREHGILFAVASGRPYVALHDIMSAFGENIIYISENGAYTRYRQNVIYKRIFDTSVINRFASWFNCTEHGILAACGLKCYYIANDISEFLDSLSSFKVNYILTDDFTDIDDEIFQLTVFFPMGVTTVKDIPLYREFGDSYEFAITHTHWVDIYPKDVNKGVGLEAVYRSFGIKSDETVVFGDFYNDIPMFLKAGHSYCLDTAPYEVKAHAGRIIYGECGYSVTEEINNILPGSRFIEL